jgi:hypothetical protein
MGSIPEMQTPREAWLVERTRKVFVPVPGHHRGICIMPIIARTNLDISRNDGASEGVAILEPEPKPKADRGCGGDPGEASVSPDPAGASKAGESRDFPYFDFYPYGYLY